MKTMSLLAIVSLMSLSAFAQSRSERLPSLIMQPGDSYMMLDPRSHQPMRVTCAGGDYPMPVPRVQVEFYKSDTCNGELVAMHTGDRSCQSLPSNVSTWAVRVDGRCMNVKDDSTQVVCERLRGITHPSATLIYKSDTCNGELLAAVTERTNCQALGGGDSAWAIRKDGRCIDIKDTSLVQACEQFR